MTNSLRFFLLSVFLVASACGGGGHNSSTPTGPAAVTCAASVSSVSLGTMASFSASGGDGNFNWSAPDGAPTSGNGTSFATKFVTPGQKTVSVVSGGSSASCVVSVAPPNSSRASFVLMEPAVGATIVGRGNVTLLVILPDEWGSPKAGLTLVNGGRGVGHAPSTQVQNHQTVRFSVVCDRSGPVTQVLVGVVDHACTGSECLGDLWIATRDDGSPANFNCR